MNPPHRATLDRRSLAQRVSREGLHVDERIREGHFQRALSLIAGLSSILSGLEVTCEHYRGSYSNRIMYTPVMLSVALLGAGVWRFRSRWGPARCSAPCRR